MKFTYEYKTSANERRSGEISASSRDDVYRKLKGDGIRPFNVTLAPGFINRIRSFGKRGLAIVALLLLACGLSVFLFRAEREVKMAGDAVRRSDRHQIYGDPSVMESMERTAYANVFSNDGERLLAFFAQPGNRVVIPADLQRDPAVLQCALTNEIVFVAGEPREVAELKGIVNGMKEELRAYLAEGDAASFLRCLYERQAQEEQIYDRVVNELRESNDPALWEARNKSLRELGLRTVSRLSKKVENSP